jgi:hypothetical protein
MKSMIRLFPFFTLLAGGCAPLVPFHFAETAETLKTKQVSLTVAAGGGGGRDVQDCCGGGSARVRVGVGHDMEVGAEFEAIGGRDTKVLTGKASYKVGFLRHFALIAGLGAGGYVGNGSPPAILGADVAAVASSPPLVGLLSVYGGARFSFSLPVSGDFYKGYPSQGFIIPVGLALSAGPRFRLYFEGGFMGGWNEGPGATMPPSTTYAKPTLSDWVGGYGALAASYTWGS